ncbi:MAG: glycosyltransferase family 2 protein [Hyphomicrobiales bacterium]|nr:glycosyltransferase family 2 protein [Hyphomicrobiales bacterium]MBV9432683.1 glycosyltransferase family 2 protein [Hyphomicrobiales bacterium]MBV9741827.1 glycosyltransferase family 2 protein [Hyphomicrobiales bacterium]
MLFGISLVRNEEDLVETTLRHHLRQGVEELLIADNGSSDATIRVLSRLAREDRRIRWSRTGEVGFHQAEFVTDLAREAMKRGASYVLPFDADEFWWTKGGLAAGLRASSADLISVPVVNFIQHRRQVRRDPRAVLTAVYRNQEKLGDFRRARFGVEAGEYAYVEAPYQRKNILRAVQGLRIGPGNHTAKGIGPKRSRRSAIVCLHLPLRAKEIFLEKAEQSARLAAAGLPLWHGWQSHRFARIVREGRIEEEWAANSQLEGWLDGVRGKVPLTFDPRLRQLLHEFVD